MNFFKRLFGKQRGTSTAADADRARSQQLAGRETGQTAAEQAGTRGRMEAELDAQRRGRAAAPTTETPPCPHTALTARWDSVADMGNDEKATGYTCQSCNQSFTGAEGRALRATEGERVRQELSTEPQEP